MLCASTMMLSSVFTNADYGIVDAITTIIGPTIGNLPPMIFVFISTLLVVVITNFISNTAALTIVYNVTVPLVIVGSIVGVNAAALTCVLGMGCCTSLAFPSGSAPAAVAAGTGWISSGAQAKIGMVLALLAVLVYTFIGYPFASMIM